MKSWVIGKFRNSIGLFEVNNGGWTMRASSQQGKGAMAWLLKMAVSFSLILGLAGCAAPRADIVTLSDMDMAVKMYDEAEKISAIDPKFKDGFLGEFAQFAAEQRVVEEQQEPEEAEALVAAQAVTIRAFWLFAKNAGDGAEDNPNRPALPDSVGGKWTSPGDVARLTGPAGPNAHVHLLVGDIALPDDNLEGGVGAGHRHYVMKIGEAWYQVTAGEVPHHEHDLNIGVGGGIVPDYFMLFWVGSQAEAALIAASPDCFPIVEADVVVDEDGSLAIGALKGGWATEDTAWWHSKVLSLLGVDIPDQIDRGNRLVMLFLGGFLGRHITDERGYRLTS